MAVTIHNTTLTAGPTSANSRGLLHTTTAGSSLLVWLHTNEATSFSSCVAGGTALTRLGVVSAGSSRAELWGMTAPNAGTLTISAAVTGNNPATWAMIATSYVGQRTIGGSPFGTVVAGTATAANVVFSISSTTADLVAFGFGKSSGAAITLGNGTLRGDITHSTTGRLVVGDITGAPTVSISATAASSNTWGWLAVPIRASVTATTTIVFDNAAHTVNATLVNSIGLLITATSNACLVVFASNAGGTLDTTFSTVAIGSTQLTRKGHVEYRLAGGLGGEVWVLTAPPSGVLTISAVIADDGLTNLGLAALTYTGHKTNGDPFGGNASSTAGTTPVLNASLSISTTAGNVVVMGFFSGMFNPVSKSVVAALTQRVFQNAYPSILVADMAIGAGITAVTGSAQAASAVEWGVLGINIIEAGPNQARSAIGAMTDVQDAFSASGYLVVQGTLTVTDAQDVFTAIAAVRISASFVVTDTPDIFSASAFVTDPKIFGTFAATDAPDQFVSTATLRITGTLSTVDNQDSFAASAQAIVQGAFAATDAADKFTSTASTRITSIFTATDVADSFAAPSYVLVSGVFTATDTPDTFAASGTSSSAFVTGTFTATDSPDIFSASATLVVISSPDAPIIVIDIGSGGGSSTRKRRHNKPQYITAQSDFWDARERYLKSLQPELSAEPEPTPIIEPVAFKQAEPIHVDPSILTNYRTERASLVTIIPTLTTIKQLRESGTKLITINQSILEQKRQQQLYERQQRTIRRKRQIARQKQLLAGLYTAKALLELYAPYQR